LREGDWKVVAEFGGPWELYDLKADRSESHDLVDSRSEIANRLIARWQAYAEETGVVDWGTFPQSKGKPTKDYRMK
jgi:arylsulfatase